MSKQRATEGPRRGDGAVRRVGKCWPQDLMLAVVLAVVEGGASAHAVAPRFDAADCLTTMRWNNIRLEIRYPGYLIQQTDDLKSYFITRLVEWNRELPLQARGP